MRLLDNYLDKRVVTLLAEKMSKVKTEPEGTVGTLNFGGLIKTDEFNTEWMKSKAIATAYKMRKTDAQVNASMLSIELPILSSQARIEPASQDNIDIEIADFVEQSLMGGTNFNWGYLLRHILMYLQYGFYLFEKVYEYRKDDNRIWLKNISPRLPKTISKWIQDDDGSLKEVVQWAQDNKGGLSEFTIKNDYIVLFVNNQEGNDWNGNSILRTAYRNWKIKDLLIRIDAIKHERHGLGLPIFKPPENAKAEDLEKAALVGETMRSHEKNYIIQPEGWTIEMLDLKTGTLSDPIASIKFHNTEISSNILAQFMDVGKTEYGSRASIYELKENFFLSLQSVAKYIEDIFNVGMEGRHVIKDLVTLNFPNVDQFPKLKFSKIANVDYKMVSEYLMNLANSGWILPRAEDEKYIREEFDLPAIEEELKPVKKESKPDIKIETTVHDHIHFQDRKPGEYWREMTDIEKSINLKEIDDKMKTFENELINIGDEFRAKMTNELITDGSKLLTRRLSIKDFSRKLIEQKISGKQEMARALSAKLKDIYDYAKSTVTQELKNMKEFQEPGESIVEDEYEAKKSTLPIAELSVAVLTGLLYTQYRKEMLSQRTLGIINTDLLKESLESLKNTAFKKEMLEKARSTFGIGRSAQALKMDAKKVIRSEIMDDRICRACAPIDGEEFTTTDPLWAQVAGGPYRNCDGGDLCRGVNIFVE